MNKKIAASLLALSLASMAAPTAAFADETASEDVTEEAAEETTSPVSEASTEMESEAESESAEETYDYSEYFDENGFFAGVTALDYVSLPEYTGVQIPASEVTPTDSEVQAKIDEMVQSYTTTEQVTEGTVEEGDSVNIDYVGTIDGVEFDGGSTDGNGTTVTAGGDDYIDDFLDQLIGHEVGETFDINVTFPDDYGVDELNGKDAVFTTTINYIEKSVVPEVTDDFVKENLGYDTVDAYKQSLYDDIYNEHLSESLLNWLIENSIVSDVPQSVVDALYQVQYDYYERLGSLYGYDVDTILSMFGSDTESLYSQCETYASNYLVLQAVMEDASLEVTPEYFMEVNNTDEDTYNTYVDYYGAGYVHFTAISNCVTDFMKQSAVVYDDSAEIESEAESETVLETVEETVTTAETVEETTEAAE